MNHVLQCASGEGTPTMTTTPHGFLRVCAAAPRIRVADPDFNVAETIAVSESAAREGVQVLVFPELSLSGYTAGDLFFSSALIRRTESALARYLEASASSAMLAVLGLPVIVDGRMYDCAVVTQRGRLLGVVPKTFIPAYKEFYEERWFGSSRDARRPEITLCGQEAAFGVDLLFAFEDAPNVFLAVEICEDLWAPIPPSSLHAVAGASVLLNLSASSEAVGKADYRRALVAQQSGRSISGYVYAGAGVHESTTDVVFGGHLMIAENGQLLAESRRFERQSRWLSADIDVQRLLTERTRQNSFGDAAHDIVRPYRRVSAKPIPVAVPSKLRRPLDPRPFAPSDPATLEHRCEEVFAIQTAGLAKRLEHAGLRRAVVGISGGLDSTLALLVATRTFDMLRLSRKGVLAVTLPGFGTTARTLENARRIAAALGVAIREIDIKPACAQHIADIGLDSRDQTSVTFQNLQARERMQILMDLANKEDGLVVGTGDLSELALGYCTFAGDHMAMYNVNCGVPKTLVRQMVCWASRHSANASEREALLAIVETPVSPELVAAEASGPITQLTEELIGPYELHDFFLFHFFRGADPPKIIFMAEQAFAGQYDEALLKRWLRVFIERFFAHQFKRSVLPDGPKVGAVSLSPRGDWRMPSDASVAAWLESLDRDTP
jgi:NAD+ synthase (glutamine-hydrolysing)